MATGENWGWGWGFSWNRRIAKDDLDKMNDGIGSLQSQVAELEERLSKLEQQRQVEQEDENTLVKVASKQSHKSREGSQTSLSSHITETSKSVEGNRENSSADGCEQRNPSAGRNMESDGTVKDFGKIKKTTKKKDKEKEALNLEDENKEEEKKADEKLANAEQQLLDRLLQELERRIEEAERVQDERGKNRIRYSIAMEAPTIVEEDKQSETAAPESVESTPHCLLCEGKETGEELLTFKDCQHQVCKTCAEKYVAEQHRKYLYPIKCPVADCGSCLNESTDLTLLTKDIQTLEYQRYFIRRQLYLAK